MPNPISLAMTMIDPAHMQQVADSLEGQRVIIENCLGGIEKDAAGLEALWAGDSAEAYKASMAKIAAASPKIVSILAEYVRDLKEIASRFISVEQKRVIASQALPADVIK